MSTEIEIVSQNRADIQDLLTKAQDRIAAVLPGHIKVDRMISVAMELIQGDSKLSLCEPVSIVKAVLEASQLGLLLNKHLGHGYLVPFQNGILTEKYKRPVYDAQFLIGYRGFVHLVMSDSPATSVYGRIVYAGEEFRISEGTQHQLIHVPSLEGRNLKDYIGAYAVVIYKDGTPADFEWMPKAEIEKIRAFSKAKGPDSPWQTWTEEQIKKTPIRRLCKRLKLSPEVIAASVRDEYRELGYEHGRPEPRQVVMPRRISELPPAPQPPQEPEVKVEPLVTSQKMPEWAGVGEVIETSGGMFSGKESGPAGARTVITEAQGRRLYAIAKGAGWKDNELKAFLLRDYHIEHSKDIERSDYEKICKELESGGGH